MTSMGHVISGFLLVLCCVITVSPFSPSHYHGNVKMGVPKDDCDNRRWRLLVDWDYRNDYEQRCQNYEGVIRAVKEKRPMLSCLENEEIPEPIHVCMTKSITYYDEPPRGGPHRPLWPVYGEYEYIPPQRWVHSLEHGAVVFLYHPCADPSEVERLRQIVRSCLRRHIITAYRKLSVDAPLALLTYGCKLTMNVANEKAAIQFIKENALNPKRAPEFQVWKNGQYRFRLVSEAEIVPDSDHQDSNLCPGL